MMTAFLFLVLGVPAAVVAGLVLGESIARVRYGRR
jgi:hypothetical protein